MKNFISNLISILIFSTNSIAQNLEITSTRIDVKVLIDSLANSINRHYIFPKKGTEISTYLKEQHKKGVYDKIEDPNILAYKLIKDIKKN